MENKIITIRSVYKVKEYHFQPTKQKNGLNWPWVKSTRIGNDGRSEMIMSDAERNSEESKYFIPEDLDIVVIDGTTFMTNKNINDEIKVNQNMIRFYFTVFTENFKGSFCWFAIIIF